MRRRGTRDIDKQVGRYVVIGLGGIGGLLLRLLVPFLHSLGKPSTVLAVDGDQFEPRNRDRMHFAQLGPKALVMAREISQSYADLVTIVPITRYVTSGNIGRLILDADVVFCQPDNHATRRVVERRCSRLGKVALFSGGNDGVEDGKSGTYGNVQIYLRDRGKDITNRLSRFHPEIAHPEDQVPTAQGCGVAFASAPQLLFTNAAVASAMLGAFYAWRCGLLSYEEAYLDITRGSAVPVSRSLPGCGPTDGRRRTSACEARLRRRPGAH